MHTLPPEAKALCELMERKHPGTYRHCMEVAAVARRVTVRRGGTEDEQQNAWMGGAFHDIGKVLNDNDIAFLDSPKKIQEMDRKDNPIAHHPVSGANYIASYAKSQNISDKLWVYHAERSARYHHSPEKIHDPIVTLIHLVDRIAARSDSSRKYLVESGTLLTEMEAGRIVGEESGERELCALIAEELQVYRSEAGLVQ